MTKGNERPPYDTEANALGDVAPAEAKDLEARLLALNNSEQGRDGHPGGSSQEEAEAEGAEGVPGKVETGYHAPEDEESEVRQKKFETWIDVWDEFAEAYDESVEKLANDGARSALRTAFGTHNETLETIDHALERVNGLRSKGTIDLADLQEDEDLAELMADFYEDYTTLWHKSSIIERMREEGESRAGKTLTERLRGVPEQYVQDGVLERLLLECPDPTWLTQGTDVIRVEHVPQGEGAHAVEKFAPTDTHKSEILVTVEVGTSAEDVAKAIRRKVAERNSWDSAQTLTLGERAQFLEEVAALFGRDAHVEPQWDDKVSEAQVKMESTHKHAALALLMYWKTLNDLYDTGRLTEGDEYTLVSRWRERILLNEDIAESKSETGEPSAMPSGGVPEPTPR